MSYISLELRAYCQFGQVKLITMEMQNKIQFEGKLKLNENISNVFLSSALEMIKIAIGRIDAMITISSRGFICPGG